MKYQKIDSNYLVVARRGDNIIASLKELCQKKSIINAYFSGIGAVDDVELAHYSVGDKKFSS